MKSCPPGRANTGCKTGIPRCAVSRSRRTCGAVLSGKRWEVEEGVRRPIPGEVVGDSDENRLDLDFRRRGGRNVMSGG